MDISGKESLIAAHNICKSFGRNSVLNGINLELSSGKLCGITGENGSGKTTLLNILAGFLRPDKGDLKLNCKVGFCPQEPYLFSNLSAEENINFFSHAYGLNRIATSDFFSEQKAKLFEIFNFSGNEKKICSKLSEGTRQKLNLIISLLHDPDLLLLDEPYTALDWDTYLRFWELAKDLKDDGKSVLIVSHLIYDKDRMDKIWKLNNGVLDGDE